MTSVRMNITLDQELEKRFRKTVADALGFKKGNLQLAIEDALEEWIRVQDRKAKPRK